MMGIPGCTNPLATNYDPLATVDDGSCVYVIDPGEGQGIGRGGSSELGKY